MRSAWVPLVRVESNDGLLGSAERGQVALLAEEVGSADLQLSFLGIPVRRTEVDIVPRLHLVPGGQSVGVMMGDGVTVTQLARIQTADGRVRGPAEEAGILPGDVIRKVGSQPITHGAQLEAAVQEYGARGEPVPPHRPKRERPDRALRGARAHRVVGAAPLGDRRLGPRAGGRSRYPHLLGPRDIALRRPGPSGRDGSVGG